MGNNAVVVNLARNKMLKARAGELSFPQITGMAFGTGGVDASGNPIIPTRGMTALRNEIFRKEIDGYEFISDLVCRYACTLAKAECVGKSISEIAMIDADGDVVAIKSFLAKGKDDDMQVTFQIDDQFDGGDS